MIRGANGEQLGRGNIKPIMIYEGGQVLQRQ